MSDEFIRKVMANFKIEASKISFGGYIPLNVIGYAEMLHCNTIAWRTSPQVQHLIFQKDLKIPDGKYAIPGLVWIFGTSLEMYAYQTWDGEKTLLYWAPFYNVDKENVCLGTASKYVGNYKALTFKDTMDRVQTAFFDSRFTHAGNEDNVKNSFIGLFEKTLNQKEFPYDYLVPAEITVKQVCDELFKSTI